MRKKIWLFQLLYYIIIPLAYTAMLYCVSGIIRSAGDFNLGAIVTITLFFLFVITPIFIIVFMRLSLLKWYVDPFAAACIPLYLYCGMVINVMNRTNDLMAAWNKVNLDLSNDGGEGWFFLGGLFLFGLATSLSIARKDGESVAVRLLAKITKE